ncbi:hypothetical protein HAX54_022520, partial [Datura stramonium]|nr:hypothetical protein [Datura stramonium]
LLREQLFEAWERFRQYILRVDNHGFPNHILLEKFYIGLDALTQFVSNQVGSKRRNQCGDSFFITFNERESEEKLDDSHFGNQHSPPHKEAEVKK